MAAKKTPPWKRRNPKKKPTKLSAAAKASAKSAAKKAGRRYPNLVDNMRAAATSKRKPSKGTKK